MAKRPVPIWATKGKVERDRALVAKQIHGRGDNHDLGHPTFRDAEVTVIDRMYGALRGDEEASALLTHFVSYIHEAASNPPR